MTRDRSFGEDTPLKGWIRHHPELDSKLGYVGTDVDLVWYNHKKAMIMLQEHKEHGAAVGPSQEATLSVLDQAIQHTLTNPDFRLISRRFSIPPNVHYCGLHTIVCQHTSPDDGEVSIDGVKVSPEDLVRFLQFEWTPVIQVYKRQADRIDTSRTLKQLKQAAKYIKSTVYEKHPEIALLRELHRKKREELRRLAALFSDEQTMRLDHMIDAVDKRLQAELPIEK
jgi:hypothetical protein